MLLRSVLVGSFMSQFPTHLILEIVHKSFVGMKLSLLP